MDKEKIDMVTWTLNGEQTLEMTLSNQEKVIPAGRIHCKIAVDGGSTDNTVQILKRYGWTVYQSPRGIPKQANFALSKVDTEFYISTESDLMFSSDWFERITKLMASDDRIAVAQGREVYKGSKSLEWDDLWTVRNPIGIINGTVGLDNNLCRTSAIRSVGGYPEEHGLLCDAALREKLVKAGYLWLADGDCHPRHLRLGRFAFFSHYAKGIRTATLVNAYWLSYPPSLLVSMKVLGYSFIKGIIEAKQMKHLRLWPASVFIGFYSLNHYFIFRSKWRVLTGLNKPFQLSRDPYP